MTMSIHEIIHYNRDENSFTARFFERLLVKFESDNSYFQHFIKSVFDFANDNKTYLKNDSFKSFPPIELYYKDGMEFMENLDLYSYCIRNNKKIALDESNIDKTEFDFVITAEDSNKKEIVIVFEVKCFQDLDIKEIQRQNELLAKYRKVEVYSDFYHIALISYENLIRGKSLKEKIDNVENFSVITWNDMKPFIDSKRFADLEFSGLWKTIHKNGRGKTIRYLIKKC
jgi:hypothetical protein